MIILHQDPCVSARELCDKDLRKTLKQAGDLAFKALENRSDENDPTLRWVCRSPANLKWTIEYAQFCAAESYYRFGRKRARVSYRVLQLPDISAGSVKELPSNPDKGRGLLQKGSRTKISLAKPALVKAIPAGLVIANHIPERNSLKT